MFSIIHRAGLISGLFLLPNLCNTDEFVVLGAAMESLDKNRNSQKTES